MKEALDSCIDLSQYVRNCGRAARTASRIVAQASTRQKNEALLAMAQAIAAGQNQILEQNRLDVAAGTQQGLADALLDRLELTPDRVASMVLSLQQVASLPDPVGEISDMNRRPSGIEVGRMRVPLGVIGIIYESRPNVTADAGALCLRSGNAAILRCGSESTHSSRAIIDAMRGALKAEGLPEDAVQLVMTTDRAAVGHMLAGLEGNVDVIVPRGGRSLVERVQKDARVPVIGHLEGLCHVIVDKAADPEKAVSIVVNAKMRRTGICGSAETLLVDAAVADDLLPKIAAGLLEAGCELRGDDRARAIVPKMIEATEADWSTEYLAPILAVAVVDDLSAALAHIGSWSSGHTECIITEDSDAADRFFATVDSAILLHNASTQFADGGEFGMGAEIGIATGRIHARGPVGAEQLTTYKYIVRGTGQVRP